MGQRPFNALFYEVVGHRHLVAVVGHGAGVKEAEAAGVGCVHRIYRPARQVFFNL